MKLYRKMEMDADGRPATGNEPSVLGVRLRDPVNAKKIRDVDAAAGTDTVGPGKGLSVDVTPDGIPPTVAGVLWEIDASALPPGLTAPQRGKRATHHQIEPAADMSLDEYQALLWGTRAAWRLVSEGDAG